jgi:hypothetical protein
MLPAVCLIVHETSLSLTSQCIALPPGRLHTHFILYTLSHRQVATSKEESLDFEPFHTLAHRGTPRLELLMLYLKLNFFEFKAINNP